MKSLKSKIFNKSILDKIYHFVEKLLYLRKFKENRIYENKEKDIYIFKDSQEEILKIQIKGILYNIRTDIAFEDPMSKLESYYNSPNVDYMDLMEVEELENLLKDYEEQEDYKSCAEIRNKIKEKTNGKTD